MAWEDVPHPGGQILLPFDSQRAFALLAALAVAAPLAAIASPTGAAPSTETTFSPTTFVNYPAPDSFPGAHGAGETSIGVDRATNNAIFLMMLDVARVHWDDAQIPPAATWGDVTFSPNAHTTLDPILYTDPATGRTFVSQLLGPTSQVSFTDDDGATWLETQPPVSAPSIDHQNIGGGPFPSPVGPVTNTTPLKSQLYYCAQLAITQCAASYDGGVTWNAPVPIHTGSCGGIVGHLHVSPLGTAFVPDNFCSGSQAVIASTTLGASWTIHRIPGLGSTNGDPSIAFDTAGKLYFSTASDGHAVVVTSADEGKTWSAPVDVGAAFGVVNTEFTMATAGDAGRAAVAFYGSTTPGNDQSASYQGAWHLYVSETFDGGATWQTTDATPNDPVQRGCIWMNGGGNPCRNLLDFQTMTVDAQGRVLIGYADGCTSAACVGANGAPGDSRDSLGTIARQTTGRRMLAAFDPSGPDPIRVVSGGPYDTDRGVAVNLSAAALGGIPPYTFSWDLDHDGVFGDATGADVVFPASGGGSYNVTVRVTDSLGASVDTSTRVRVHDASREVLVGAWSFDADPTCSGNVADGWAAPGLAGTNVSALTWHLAVGGADASACSWANAVYPLGEYPPDQDATLVSPGGSGCFAVPDDVALARFVFQVGGSMEQTFDKLDIGYEPCGGSAVTHMLTLTGPQGANEPTGYATVSLDLSQLIGAPAFRLVFHATSDASVEQSGYRLDSFALYEQG